MNTLFVEFLPPGADGSRLADCSQPKFKSPHTWRFSGVGLDICAERRDSVYWVRNYLFYSMAVRGVLVYVALPPNGNSDPRSKSRPSPPPSPLYGVYTCVHFFRENNLAFSSYYVDSRRIVLD